MADTIFAPASAPGRAGVSVIRISGDAALDAARALAGTLPPPRHAGLRRLRDTQTGDLLDAGLVVTFPGPGSFTGEDCAELHVHGSVAVIRSVCTALSAIPGLRPAEPGEFTRRAFTRGRLDLSQVEALGDLIAAETEAQHRQAMAALDGRVGRLSARWAEVLLEALAHVEATIDFADEDLPAGILAAMGERLSVVAEEMRRELKASGVAERIREGFEVAIVGRPNAGKSTLLNAIAGREAALVSELPGTTRDVLEVRLELSGLPVTLLDTAGIRDGAGRVETLGIDRARQRAASADLRLYLVETVGEVGTLGVAKREGDLVMLAKADLRDDGVGVSGLTGQGIEWYAGGDRRVPP